MSVSFNFVAILTYVGATYGYASAMGAVLIGGKTQYAFYESSTKRPNNPPTQQPQPPPKHNTSHIITVSLHPNQSKKNQPKPHKIIKQCMAPINPATKHTAPQLRLAGTLVPLKSVQHHRPQNQHTRANHTKTAA